MTERWSAAIRLGIIANKPLIVIWGELRQAGCDLPYIDVQMEFTRLSKQMQEVL